jgi:CTP:molybdopterin cytidylyltransferase MocA
VVHIAHTWRELGAGEIFVTWNPEVPVPAELESTAHVVPNHEVDLGPLHSLQLALRQAVRKADDIIAMTPIDVPPPRPFVLSGLFDQLINYDAVHPQVAGKGGHPLLMRNSMIGGILELDPLTDRLDHFLKRSRVLRVPFDDCALTLNLNDEAAWNAWLTQQHRD